MINYNTEEALIDKHTNEVGNKKYGAVILVEGSGNN